MAHDIKKNGWNIDSEDVAKKSPPKEDWHSDSFIIVSHGSASHKLFGQVNWSGVVKKSSIKSHKSLFSDIKFEIKGASLGVEWIPGHVVETDELGLVHSGHLHLAVASSEDPNVLVVMHVGSSVGEVFIGQNPHDWLL